MRYKRAYIFNFYFGIALILILVLSGNNDRIESFDLDKYNNTNSDGINEFIFEENINLHGNTVYIPAKCKLIFKGGILSNGRIIGDSTEIIYDEYPIFSNIEIDGSWKIEQLSTKLFASTDSCTLTYLSILSSDKQYNVIRIDDDCRIPIKPWSSYFLIKSNTDLILNADIYTLPTHYKGGYCIGITGEKIKVTGNGHFLFGTLACKDQKECPQWLHGLNIDSKSQNVFVENLNSWLFCGDGFYNSGSDVILDKIIAKFNGRQGLSITNGSNIKVLNSLFTHTGYYRICNSGGPGAGIDIEPNDDDRVNNIQIDSCIIRNNYRYRKGFVNDLEVYNAEDADVRITNCLIGGIYLGSCSGIIVSKCSELKTILGIDTNIRSISISHSGQPELSDKIKDLINLNGY